MGSFAVLEIPIRQTRLLAEKLYRVQIDSRISTRGRADQLLLEIPKLTLKESYQFYEKIKKIKMSFEVHILRKNYLGESVLLPKIKKIVNKLGLRFDTNTDYYVACVPDFGNQLEFYINNNEAYTETLDPLYYPDIPDYGANIIIGYYEQDEILIPFLQNFLIDFPDSKVYVGEDLPQGINHHLYSKKDFEKPKTIIAHDFIQVQSKSKIV